MNKILNSKYLSIYIFSISVIIAIAAGYLIKFFFPIDTQDIDLIGEIAANFSEKLSFEGSVRRAPLYPFLLGVFYLIFGKFSSFALILMHSIIFGLISVVIYKISLEIYSSKKKSAFISILATLNPIALWYVPKFYVVILFTLLFIITVWYAYKSFNNQKLIYPILFGFFTGIACLTKAVLLLFPVFLGGILLLIQLFLPKRNLFDQLTIKSTLKITLVSTLFLILTISPWTIRNKIVSGKWIIVSSNTSVEFFRGNSYAQDNSFLINGGIGTLFNNAIKREDQIIKNYGIKDFQRINHIDADLDSIFNPLMKDYILNYPDKFVMKTVKQIPPFWYFGRDNSFSIIRLIIAALLIILFFVAVKKKPTKYNFFISLSIIYLNLIYAATIATARYSLPLYPLMLIPVGYYLHHLIYKVFKKNDE